MPIEFYPIVILHACLSDIVIVWMRCENVIARSNDIIALLYNWSSLFSFIYQSAVTFHHPVTDCFNLSCLINKYRRIKLWSNEISDSYVDHSESIISLAITYMSQSEDWWLWYAECVILESLHYVALSNFLPVPVLWCHTISSPLFIICPTEIKQPILFFELSIDSHSLEMTDEQASKHSFNRALHSFVISEHVTHNSVIDILIM